MLQKLLFFYISLCMVPAFGMQNDGTRQRNQSEFKKSIQQYNTELKKSQRQAQKVVTSCGIGTFIGCLIVCSVSMNQSTKKQLLSKPDHLINPSPSLPHLSSNKMVLSTPSDPFGKSLENCNKEEKMIKEEVKLSDLYSDKVLIDQAKQLSGKYKTIQKLRKDAQYKKTKNELQRVTPTTTKRPYPLCMRGGCNPPGKY